MLIPRRGALMSVLRPYRLERELDSAFYHWLAWLPQWEPRDSYRRTSVCTLCPRYVDALGLEELPHGPLHGIFGAVELLLAQQFDREVAAQFPELRERDEWIVTVDSGLVRFTTHDGDSLDSVLEREGDGVVRPATLQVQSDQVADARVALIRTYWTLFENAVARLGRQKSLILRAVDAHVEPKVRKLADELVAEICRAA